MIDTTCDGIITKKHQISRQLLPVAIWSLSGETQDLAATENNKIGTR